MITSNANNSLINYGDMFRISKYYKVLRDWDTVSYNRNYLVYLE